MKGGFINPPNNPLNSRTSRLSACFNEGRVYKPAEPYQTAHPQHGLYAGFNEGRVYKPAELMLLRAASFNEGRVYKPAEPK